MHDYVPGFQSLPTKPPRAAAAAAYVLASGAEGELEDLNIGSGFREVVNVFLTCPVLVFVYHTWVIVWGGALNRKNGFAVSVSVNAGLAGPVTLMKL